jgi:hypothetical protein
VRWLTTPVIVVMWVACEVVVFSDAPIMLKNWSLILLMPITLVRTRVPLAQVLSDRTDSNRSPTFPEADYDDSPPARSE